MSVSSVIEGASFHFRLWHVRGEVERAGLKARHYKRRQDAGFEAGATMHLRAVFILAPVVVYRSISISVVRLGSCAVVLTGGLG
jgi:hypothetical protein